MYGNVLEKLFQTGGQQGISGYPPVGILRYRETIVINIGTSNVRTLLQTGKLEKGDFISEDYRVIYTDGDIGRNGVGIILSIKWAQCVISYIAQDDRIIIIKLKGTPTRQRYIVSIYTHITSKRG